MTAIRHLVSSYGESYFKPDAINYKNKYGTLDVGIEQINSCHWCYAAKVTDWMEFCNEYGYDPTRLAQLMDPKINLKFAAWINEITMKRHLASYHFADKPGKKKLYFELLAVIKKEAL